MSMIQPVSDVPHVELGSAKEKRHLHEITCSVVTFTREKLHLRRIKKEPDKLSFHALLNFNTDIALVVHSFNLVHARLQSSN
jgi:hypothetical protein